MMRPHSAYSPHESPTARLRMSKDTRPPVTLNWMKRSVLVQQGQFAVFVGAHEAAAAELHLEVGVVAGVERIALASARLGRARATRRPSRQ